MRSHIHCPLPIAGPVMLATPMGSGGVSASRAPGTQGSTERLAVCPLPKITVTLVTWPCVSGGLSPFVAYAAGSVVRVWISSWGEMRREMDWYFLLPFQPPPQGISGHSSPLPRPSQSAAAESTCSLAFPNLSSHHQTSPDTLEHSPCTQPRLTLASLVSSVI